MFILLKTRIPARSYQFSNCTIAWYQINKAGSLNQNWVFQELYACTLQS